MRPLERLAVSAGGRFPLRFGVRIAVLSPYVRLVLSLFVLHATCNSQETRQPGTRVACSPAGGVVMPNGRQLVTGLGVGAGLAFLLDPARGARRRARIRDSMTHAATLTRRAAGTTGRDVVHRTYGAAAALRSVVRREHVDDQVLVERVRAKLGRFVSHAHPLHVAAADGVVTLSGPILEREAARLLSAVHRVRGVHAVIDQLERYEQQGGVPALQGGRLPGGDRVDMLQTHWAPATRVLVGAAGSALATAGLLRRDLAGTLAALAGTALVVRAAVNEPVNRLSGVGSRRRAVDVQKTVTINAPVGEVYAFWSSYENFPRFMSRVLDVRPSTRHQTQSHWKVAGPAGMTVTFDAEMTRVVQNQMIAWKTLPGAMVAHAGIVRFDPGPDGRTRVHIRMSYNPPAGWLGHSVATAFGVDPKTSMDEDLVRMKTLIETGHAPRDAASMRRPTNAR